MARLDDLRVRQLDDALAPFKALQERPPPSDGWARTIRDALGMSLRQVAQRAGVSRTTVRSAEANEAKGTVQLDSLRLLAQALDCELVYALVPTTSLGRTVEQRAVQMAEAVVGRVSESMDLEDQGVSEVERRRQVGDMAAQILRDRNRSFWDV